MRKIISLFIILLTIASTSEAIAASQRIEMSELHRAAFYNDVEEIERLLSDNMDINIRATNDVTPLQMAAHQGNLEAAKILIEKGADPDLLNSKDETALDVAIRKGKANVADYLFSVTKTDKKNNQSTPIPENAVK